MAYLTIFMTIVIINAIKQWPTGTSYISIFKMHFCQLPYLFTQFAPLASLGSSVYVFYNLGHSNEMTSLLSFGYSPYKLLVPTFIAGLFFTLVVVFVSEEVVPTATEASREIRHSLEKRELTSHIKNQDWFRNERIFYSYSSYNPQTKVFQNFYVVSIDEDFKVSEVKKCKRVYYYEPEKSWHGFDVETTQYSKMGEHSTQTTFQEQIKINVDPQKLLSKQKKEDGTSLVKISKQITNKEKTGTNSIGLIATWHAKLAYMLSSLLFAFCGFNLIFVNTQRRRKTVLVFLPYMLLAIIYWSFFITFKSLAEAGEINPIVGGWTANILLVLYIITQLQANKKSMGYSIF